MAIAGLLWALLFLPAGAIAQSACTVTANLTGSADTPGSLTLIELRVPRDGSVQPVFASSNTNTSSPGSACGIPAAANESIDVGGGRVRMNTNWTVRFANGALLGRSARISCTRRHPVSWGRRLSTAP